LRLRRRRKDELVLGYDPRRDGDADPGEVVWGWVPYEEDPTQGKDRPVAIIGRWGAGGDGDVAAVALTSRRDDDDPDRFPVGSGAWDSSGRPSYAKLDRVLRFAQASVRREGCALDRDRYDALLDALRARSRRR
jgi:hypothetical protein